MLARISSLLLFPPETPELTLSAALLHIHTFRDGPLIGPLYSVTHDVTHNYIAIQCCMSYWNCCIDCFIIELAAHRLLHELLHRLLHELLHRLLHELLHRLLHELLHRLLHELLHRLLHELLHELLLHGLLQNQIQNITKASCIELNAASTRASNLTQIMLHKPI